jgi:myosin-light-chain kinase
MADTHDRGSQLPSATTGKPGHLLEKYHLGKVLGQGAFGLVYSCKKKGSKEEYAVKMIDKVETPLDAIKHEAKMLEDLKHPSIVKLQDVFYETAFVCMVMTIYKGGDMIKAMQLHWNTKGMLPIPVVVSMSKQMITSIAWLHSHHVVHRDVKGDNFLVDHKEIENPECRIYLNDFGTVCTLEAANTRLTSKCGTKTYWAPEIFAMNYGLKVDVWALGVMMYSLVTGRFPFKGEDNIKNKKIQIPARATVECGALLQGLLDRNEDRRLTAEDALAHVFCKGTTSLERPSQQLVEEQAFEIEKKMMMPQQLNIIGTASNPLQVVHHNGKSTKLQSVALQKTCSCGSRGHPGMQILGDGGGGDDAKKNAATALKKLRAPSQDHLIDVESFSQDEAETLDEFSLEIQKGTALPLLDARQERREGAVDGTALELGACNAGRRRWLRPCGVFHRSLRSCYGNDVQMRLPVCRAHIN